MSATYRAAKGRFVDTFEPLRPVYDAWMALIRAFSWVVVRVGLAAAFVTIVLLYGVALRITRRDPLRRRIDADAPTYWTDNVVLSEDLADFENQY